MSKNKIIPIFFAADENYAPYLATALHSLLENANKEFHYQIHVLHAGMDCESENVKKLEAYNSEKVTLSFVDVEKQMQDVKENLHLRDYYTGATYYRIFIANMFPQYDKALYLDSDILLLGDVSELYATELGENLVGAVPDGAVASVSEFALYTKEALGISFEKYFNAGVLLMNLKAFREYGFYQKFCALLKEYKFTVAQDQDYLNVICKDKVEYLGEEWNRMPLGMVDKGERAPKLIHYNLTMKPWHYRGVTYEEYFWAYAKKTAFYENILNALNAYTQAQKDGDKASEKALIEKCVKEANDENNYSKRQAK